MTVGDKMRKEMSVPEGEVELIETFIMALDECKPLLRRRKYLAVAATLCGLSREMLKMQVEKCCQHNPKNRAE
jgi:hypothetical protein